MKLFDTTKIPFFLNGSAVSTTIDQIDYNALASWDLDENEPESTMIAIFHRAAFLNILKKVKQGVAAKLPLDVINEQGFSLLTLAARGGALETLLYLISDLKLNPAFCDPTNKVRHNALHAACAGGHFHIAKILITMHPKLLSIDMPEPCYLLSPLQTAISENQFDCVENIIAELNPNMHFSDKRGRTPLALLFCCYVNAEFNTLKEDPIKLKQLEKFCLRFLETENAFNGFDENAKPAYLVLKTCELAVEEPSGTELTQRIDVESLLITIMVKATELAATLLVQAQKNDEGNLESEFITLFNRCTPKLTRETDAALRSFMNLKG